MRVIDTPEILKVRAHRQNIYRQAMTFYATGRAIEANQLMREWHEITRKYGFPYGEGY